MENSTGFGEIEKRKKVKGKMVSVVLSVKDQLREKCPVWDILDSALSHNHISAFDEKMGICHMGVLWVRIVQSMMEIMKKTQHRM